MSYPKPKGAFRGAKFYVLSHRTRVGRRQPTHALPFQDKGAASTDLGRAPRVFSLTVCVIGADYRTARKALIDALEKKGPGLLIHPEHGRVNVTVGDHSEISESTEQGGMATVSITATEAFDQPAQVPSVDTGSALKSAAKAGRLAAKDSFKNPKTGLKTLVSDIVAAMQLDTLNTVLADMRSVNGMVSSVLAQPGMLAAKIDDISRTAEQLLNTPQRLADSLDGAFEQIGNACKRIFGSNGEDIDQADAVDASALSLRRGKTLARAVGPIADLGSSIPDGPDVDTQDRRDEQDSLNALRRHSRALGLFNLADAAAEAPFDSADDALEVRDALADALVTLAESEPDLDAPLANALKRCASAVMQHLSVPMPSVVGYTPATALPAEVIAYLLYADPERADEIVLRNPQIKHPGLIPAAQEIQVLSA